MINPRERGTSVAILRPFRRKLVQVRVASLFLRIQRGMLEDDLSIFLLFYESLYHAIRHSNTEYWLLSGVLALS